MTDIEFLWFEDCPNHFDARAMLLDVLRERGVEAPIRDIDAAPGGFA
jgi:hypothetical protein